MSFNDWAKAVRRLAPDAIFADITWLQDQFSQGQSPAIVAQLIRVGSYSRVPAFKCPNCGCTDFTFATDGQPRTASVASYYGPAVVALLLLAPCTFGITAIIAVLVAIGWVVHATYAGEKSHLQYQRRRCVQCKYTEQANEARPVTQI